MNQADLRGKFIWHELMTPNIQGAAEFYARVLPWSSEASTVPGYTLCMSGRWGVAGLMRQPDAAREQSTPPNWLVYVGAPDVDATAEAAQRLGGKLLKAPTDIPGIGRFAVLSDPQGAAFAVFAPAMPMPEGAQAEPPGHFSWHELATIDPQGALAFYAQLFGWTRGPVHEMGSGGRYQVIEHAGVPIGGMYVMQDPSKPPHWLSYVQVRSLDETIAAVRAYGGRVVLEPHVVPGGDRVAHILDPQGGAIALHERPSAAPGAGTPPPARSRRAARPRKSPAAAAPAKKSAGTAASARKAPTRKAAANKAARGATTPRTKTGAKRSTAGTIAQTTARRTSARKSAATRRPARKQRAAKPAARRSMVHKAAAKRSTARTAAQAATRRPARKQRAAKPAARRSTVHKTAVRRRPGGRRPAGKAQTAVGRARSRARRR